MTRACVTHEAIEPVFDADSRVLLLGTMPSPRSRAERFYYAHPQNRMWRVLAAVFDSPLPVTVEEKKQFLLSHRIAMWDVLASCEIEGASDTSIRNPVPNDLDRIFSVAAISAVFTAGGTAHRLLKKLTGRDSVRLPSTSPANCAMPTESLVEAYRIVARATEGQTIDEAAVFM